MTSTKKVISIITPCYNEEGNVEACYESVKNVFESSLPDYTWEHIFCDNDSSDNTQTILQSLAQKDSRVKVILNARNYGPFRSTFNGLLNATGDAVVVLLAADLQDPPEILPEFVAQWEQGFEVVYGIRSTREEHPIMRNIRKMYYRMVSKFANISIPLDVGEFQLIDKAVLNALKQHDDNYPYIRGMIANCGFRSFGIPYNWRARRSGFSKNRLYHLIDQGLNGLISFTNLPMRLCMFTGFAIAALSFLYAFLTLVINLIYFGTITVPGIPTIITALFIFNGIQLMFLGIIGEYISAIHNQVRKKPLVVEREKLNF